MRIETLRPVAFMGENADATVSRLYALEPRFLPVAVPAGSAMDAALAGLRPLGFLGAVLDGSAAGAAARLVERRSHAAERDGAVDAIASHASATIGAHVLDDAIASALEASGFRALGGHAVIAGSGANAFAATQLARLGLRSITVAAPDRPAAERVARAVPAGVSVQAISLTEDRVADALDRADLVVLCSADAYLDPRRFAPFHTLVEVAGESSLAVAVERAGGQVVPFAVVAAHRLAAQLEFVTGLKFDASRLA